MDRPVIKFGDIKAGDVIKYNFVFPQQEEVKTPPIIGTAISEVFEVTPKHCILEYTSNGKKVKIPYESVVSIYRKVNG